MIHQLWWTADQIDYDDLGQQLGIEVITVSSILQPPGCVVPYHRDTFFQISWGSNFSKVRRRDFIGVMYLEDGGRRRPNVLKYFKRPVV